jgi:predicted Rossmann-fold nucleotide-binding protein
VRKHLLKRGKIAEEDFNLFTVTDSITKAADEIAHFYKNYHSVRYVRDRMVIRLNPPDPSVEPGCDGE